LAADLDERARGSPFYQRYDWKKAGWVRDPGVLPNTDLSFASEQG